MKCGSEERGKEDPSIGEEENPLQYRGKHVTEGESAGKDGSKTSGRGEGFFFYGRILTGKGERNS